MGKVPKALLRLDKLEESRKTLELRRSGLTYREIGEIMGISPAGARQRVQHLISRTEQLVSTEAYEIIQKQMDTLDAIIETHIVHAMDGDTKSADVVIKALQRQSKLLGIDATERTAIGLNYTEIISKLKEMGRRDLLERISRGEDITKVVAGEIDVWATRVTGIEA